jgi:hypothetical protein
MPAAGVRRSRLAVLLESMFVQALKAEGGPARARFAKLCHKYIKECAPPEYHDLLLPNEAEIPVACKRRVFDAGYIPALGRSNVELCGVSSMPRMPLSARNHLSRVSAGPSKGDH